MLEATPSRLWFMVSHVKPPSSERWWVKVVPCRLTQCSAFMLSMWQYSEGNSIAT